MPDPETSRAAGELVPLRRTTDDEVELELPRLEPLTAAEEAEAVELLAALLAAASGRRPERGLLGEAA